MIGRKLRIYHLAAGVIATLLFVTAGLLPYLTASGVQSTDRYLQIGSSGAGDTTTYKVGFDVLTTGPIGSLRVQFCSNSPFIGTPCTAPSGFDISQATLSTQTGVTGFGIDASTTANVLVLTRIPFAAVPVQASYTLSNVVNPSAVGSYYARIETFASTDTSGSHTDYGGVAFDINDGVAINTTVPPFLLFCTGIVISSYDCTTASGDYINFGSFSSSSASSATSQMVAATNGDNGYGIFLTGTTLISGNNIIPSINGNDVSRPGTSQFGLNLRANSDPAVGADPTGPGVGTALGNYNIPNRYSFGSNDQLVGIASPDDLRKYTVSYLVNISKDQAPGIYVSTLTYVAIANF